MVKKICGCFQIHFVFSWLIFLLHLWEKRNVNVITNVILQDVMGSRWKRNNTNCIIPFFNANINFFFSLFALFLMNDICCFLKEFYYLYLVYTLLKWFWFFFIFFLLLLKNGDLMNLFGIFSQILFAPLFSVSKCCTLSEITTF